MKIFKFLIATRLPQKMHPIISIVPILLIEGLRLASGSTGPDPNQKSESIKIAKCCEDNSLLLDDKCVPISDTNETLQWQPEFDFNQDGRVLPKRKLRYTWTTGFPRCDNNEHAWPVYYYPEGSDRLVILPSGNLRHYTKDLHRVERPKEVYYDFEEDEEQKSMHYDYPFERYCADKAILSQDHLVATYAMICVPEPAVKWKDTGYLMRHGIDPTFHAISISSYLIVAVVYFVLPQLRDLVGNMITSMTLCLITSQCAETVRIFTEYGNHVNFLIADTVTYVSLLAAFFWLNAFGYYVWNTFRSRNVFLRVTDGRKYCYYSTYVWGSTVCVAGTAIFAHFTLETTRPTIGGTLYPPQETIGWLGLSVLFTCVAFTIIIDLCFVLTTANAIKRMSTYGRIHHKMKYSFRMFVFLYAIMSMGWLSLLLSQLKYDVLVYCHIFINLLQALLILYVCIFGQRRVTFLLGKTCNCCSSGENVDAALDWGEEMTAINAGY